MKVRSLTMILKVAFGILLCGVGFGMMYHEPGFSNTTPFNWAGIPVFFVGTFIVLLIVRKP